MPTYDYQCDNCNHLFEAFQSFHDEPLSVCPECDTPALRRLISGGTGIIFKGSGFYVNDSKSSGSSGSKSSGGATSNEKSDSARGGTDKKTTEQGKSGSNKESSSAGTKKTA